MSKYYIRRNGWYHYFRHVPRKLNQYDSRKLIRIPLKTKDEKEVIKIATIYNDFVEKYWADLIRTKTSDSSLELYNEVKQVAMAHGFAYKNMSDVLNSPLDEILSRVEASQDAPRAKSTILLGGIPASSLPLKECLKQFWPLCSDRLRSKNEHQIRKFKNPRIAAMAHFIKVVGSIQLADLKRSHALKFRSWLMDQIADKKIVGNTANKQIGYVKDILCTVGQAEEAAQDFKIIFAELRVKEDKKSRPPFEASYVQDSMINSLSLKNLNFDAQMLSYMMMDTGARETEIIGLDKADFFLNETVPYIWIRKNVYRDLKTSSSERKIPLVGISLWAARQISQQGIKRYRANPDSASAAINKYLTENKLKPTPQHTLYSLRHTFKDRLRDVGAPEEVIDELMGHKKHGPQYGRGHTLETKCEWLKKIAYQVPAALVLKK